MTDSVLDWDSLWERVKKRIDPSKISTFDDFKQKMITDFFKGKTNPKGFKSGHEDLIRELWDRNQNEFNIPKEEVVVIPLRPPTHEERERLKKEKLLGEIARGKEISKREAKEKYGKETTQQLGRRVGGLKRVGQIRAMRRLREFEFIVEVE